MQSNDIGDKKQQNQNNKHLKLSIGDKLGYGAASAADSIVYCFIGSFLMFFLTTVAGVDPAAAGTISAVGAIWNAFFNPIMGYFSDGVRTRLGRRRPVMMAFALPLAASVTLLYTNMPFGGAKPIYYAVMLMLTWTCYTGFFVPYLALGAAYTTDYDDRTVLRLFASFFNMVGNVAVMILPTVFVSKLETSGMSTSGAWTLTAAILGGIAFFMILVTFIASKEKDPPCADLPEDQPCADLPDVSAEASSDKKHKAGLVSIFKEYISVAMLKPMKHLIFASAFSLIAYSIVIACMIYYLTYVLGYSSAAISAVLLIRALAGMALIPVTGRLALKTDKRNTLIMFNTIGTAALVTVRFTGADTIPTLVLFILGSVCATVIYWQIMPGIYYDVSDYDRLKTGKSRQGTIVSFQGLIEAAAAGIGSLILGCILRFAGFDGSSDVQTLTAITWIKNCTTIIPVIFLALASLSIYRYPITREKHAAIIKALDGREREM